MAKEEVPLTFFTLLGIYFFWWAKYDPNEKKSIRWVNCSSICFGLSFASQYMLHLFGMTALVGDVAARTGVHPRRPWRTHVWRMLAVTALTFVLANPVILVPSNLTGMLHYMDNVPRHHGYNFKGRIYLNDVRLTPFGVPWYFYLMALAIKTPLIVLAALLIGGVLLLSEQRTMESIIFRAFVLLSLLGISLMGAKMIRYILSTLPFICMTAGYTCQKGYDWYRARRDAAFAKPAFAAAALALFAWPLAETLSWFPYYQLYLNGLGGGRANAARFFPPDEIYDLNAKQEVETACRVAGRGVNLAVSNPTGTAFYLRSCGRTDIRVVPLYDANYAPKPGDLLFLQDSRRYFETEGLFRLMEHSVAPHFDVRAGSLVTSRIYEFPSARTPLISDPP
jgi:hypothetical protein